jgi:hypothetical protein
MFNIYYRFRLDRKLQQVNSPIVFSPKPLFIFWWLDIGRIFYHQMRRTFTTHEPPLLQHNKNVLLVFNSKSVSLRTEVSEVFNKFLCAHHPPNNHRHRHSSSLFSKLINLGRSENHSLQNSHERRHPGRFSARLEFPGDSVIELPRRGWRTTRINSPPGWFLRFGGARTESEDEGVGKWRFIEDGRHEPPLLQLEGFLFCARWGYHGGACGVHNNVNNVIFINRCKCLWSGTINFFRFLWLRN